MEFKDLIGKTITEILVEDDEIVFIMSDSVRYLMTHHQDCCENVYIEDICGDIKDLYNTPVVDAREDTNSDESPPDGPFEPDSYTWTFYNIATKNGHVTIRWFGESNGYYSESVNFHKVEE